MFAKHRLREVPAGKMMKYIRNISKHTIHPLPLFLPSLNAKTTVPLPCIQFGTSAKESGGPPMQHRPHKSSCLVGERGNSVSISPCLSRIKIPGTPELSSCRRKADWPISTASSATEEQEDGTQLVSPLTNIGHFLYCMTGSRYHSTQAIIISGKPCISPTCCN